MDTLTKISRELIPYIVLILVTLFLEFDIKYKSISGIQNFYIRGIRILMLIVIAVRLNEYGGVYSYISFVLTYIICAILDKRYRAKIERCWEESSEDIKTYLEKNKSLKFREWVRLRLRPFKNSYSESYSIFIFKSITMIVLCIIMLVLYKTFFIK